VKACSFVWSGINQARTAEKFFNRAHGRASSADSFSLDLTDKREVTFEEAQKVAEDAGCLFFETSAKTSTNVAMCFNALVDRMAQLL